MITYKQLEKMSVQELQELIRKKGDVTNELGEHPDDEHGIWLDIAIENLEWQPVPDWKGWEENSGMYSFQLFNELNDGVKKLGLAKEFWVAYDRNEIENPSYI